jgi:hypothetical protein
MILLNNMTIVVKKRIVDIPSKIDPAINLLKLIAMIAMTIDHIGHFLYPNAVWFRLVGRIAAPIFAYLIVMGLKNTKSLSQYVWRLVVLAIISQVVFFLTTSHAMLNIIFNFLGIIVLTKGPIWLKPVLIPIYLLFDIELGWLILAIGVIYYYCKCSQFQPFLVLTATILYCFSYIWAGYSLEFYAIQLMAGITGFLILIVNNLSDWLRESKLLMRFWPRYIFYAYYPLHWLVLYTIKTLVG